MGRLSANANRILGAINAELKPFGAEWPASRMGTRKNETATLGIARIIKSLAEVGVLHVDFEFEHPDGVRGAQRIRIETHKPLVLIPVVGGEVVYCLNYYIATGHVTVLPRGRLPLGFRGDAEQMATALFQKTLGQGSGCRVVAVRNVVPLGVYLADPAAMTDVVPVLLAEFDVEGEIPKHRPFRPDLRLRKVPLHEATQRIGPCGADGKVDRSKPIDTLTRSALADLELFLRGEWAF